MGILNRQRSVQPLFDADARRGFLGDAILAKSGRCNPQGQVAGQGVNEPEASDAAPSPAEFTARNRMLLVR